MARDGWEAVNKSINGNEVALGLALVRMPKAFLVVRGVLEKLTPSEISKMFKVNYVYVLRFLNKLAKSGYATKQRVSRYSFYLPTPRLAKAFRVALREIYAASLNDKSVLSKYGLSEEELVKLLGSKHGGDYQ